MVGVNGRNKLTAANLIMAIQSINPATNQVLKTFTPHTFEQVEQLLTQADETYREWRNTRFTERADLMRRAAQELKENEQHYAELISSSCR